jgi:hypothetical protein
MDRVIFQAEECADDSARSDAVPWMDAFPLLVPKLCWKARPCLDRLRYGGTHLSSKLCFAIEATELPGQWQSQTEFGNEDNEQSFDRKSKIENRKSP